MHAPLDLYTVGIVLLGSFDTRLVLTTLIHVRTTSFEIFVLKLNYRTVYRLWKKNKIT